jgi:glycosyltransferase involved in cell wall biosynthesis
MDGLDFKLFIGDDVPNSKVRSTKDLSSINYCRLKTRFIPLKNRILPWHIHLIKKLREFFPDVIICEGESNFFSYVQALLYRYFFDKNVKLIHWSYGGLPGGHISARVGLRRAIKWVFRKFFDAFIVYSSYGKLCLVNSGINKDKIFVATNVGDTEGIIARSKSYKKSKMDYRKEVGLEEKFTVLYVGTMDDNKRPDIMLKLAQICDKSKFNFVLLGDGILFPLLKKYAKEHELSNVYLPGRITNNLPIYFQASDVFLMPGRGGIAISEAMSYGLPVVVHQGDGTEYDLVENGFTGFRIKDNNVEAFQKAIEDLAIDKRRSMELGTNGLNRVKRIFNTDNMVKNIMHAISYIMRI